MHLPSSKTTLIQIIGRALRLHKDKTFAKIILPFSSKEDESSIVNFMKVMAKNDTRIKKSFESKKVGGYISIENIHEDDNKTNNEESNDINFKYDLIFDSMGVIYNNREIWEKRLEELKKYIEKNSKLPTDYNNNKIGTWLSTQKYTYKKKINIMAILNVYDKWTEFINNDKYKKYFISNEDDWKNKLEEVKQYIDKNNKRPSQIDIDKNIKVLGAWISSQVVNYKNKTQIMNNLNIYDIWSNFINDDKYKIYFIHFIDEWKNKLIELQKYLDENNKKPSITDNNENIIKIGTWLYSQVQNYKKKLKIMKNIDIYNIWTIFINDDKYKKYFISNENIWKNKLEELKKYINENKKMPAKYTKDNNIKDLNRWISKQFINYTNKINIMSNPIIYNEWHQFINDKKYFISNEDEWNIKLEDVKKYIDDNKKKPSIFNNNILGYWIRVQLRNYKNKSNIMTNPNIYNNWSLFINDEKYKKYFK